MTNVMAALPNTARWRPLFDAAKFRSVGNAVHTNNTKTIGKHGEVVEQVAQLSQRTARRLKSVEILSAAAQLYEKSHLTRRIALSCGIKISPVGSLD